jgi:hypothetical protein
MLTPNPSPRFANVAGLTKAANENVAPFVRGLGVNINNKNILLSEYNGNCWHILSKLINIPGRNAVAGKIQYLQ